MKNHDIGDQFIINRKMMMEYVYNQLAIDYNSSLDDFLKLGVSFTEERENNGRQPFPWVTPRLEMVTMGQGVVINASEDILPYYFTDCSNVISQRVAVRAGYFTAWAHCDKTMPNDLL